MLKKIFNTKSKTITSAALILGAAYLGSRLLGLFRDRLLAGTFGAGDELDIYYAAFRIPDLVYSLLIMGAISAGFIPVFTNYLNLGANLPKREIRSQGSSQEAWYLANGVLNLMIIAMLIICGGLILLAPYIIPLIAPGFSAEKISLTVSLTRIMFLSPFFLGLSAVFGGILQSFKRFFVYSLGPVLYNLGIIFGILFLVKPFGLAGLAYGVVLGSFLHMFIQIPSAVLCGWHAQWIFDLTHQGIRRILKLMPARTLSLAVSQINFLVMTIIASFLAAGSLAVYNLAYNIYAFPLGIFGVSLAVAAFPHLSEQAAKKDWSRFVKNFSATCRQILFLTIPAAALFIVLRQHLVRVILGTGQFDWQDTVLTWQTLGWFAIGVFAEALILLLIRTFFALENTLIPFLVGLVGVGIRLAGALILVQYFQVAGLALGYSLGSFVYLIFLWIFLRRKVTKVFRLRFASSETPGLPESPNEAKRSLESPTGNRVPEPGVSKRSERSERSLESPKEEKFVLDEKNIFLSASKIILASLVAALVCYLIISLVAPFFNLQTGLGIFLQGLLAGSAGLLVYLILTFLLRSPEMILIWQSFRNRF